MAQHAGCSVYKLNTFPGNCALLWLRVILGRHKSHDCLGCLSNYTTNSGDSYTKLVGHSTVVDTLIDKEIET